MAANSLCSTMIKLALFLVAMVILFTSVLSAPAGRSPLDSCMYSCHDEFNQCFTNSNFTYRGELNQCVTAYNICFRGCYSSQPLWW